MPPEAVLEVHPWHTVCGNCGHGAGGWAAGINRVSKPLGPDSTDCHECGARFYVKLDVYSGKRESVT